MFVLNFLINVTQIYSEKFDACTEFLNSCDTDIFGQIRCLAEFLNWCDTAIFGQIRCLS